MYKKRQRCRLLAKHIEYKQCFKKKRGLSRARARNAQNVSFIADHAVLGYQTAIRAVSNQFMCSQFCLRDTKCLSSNYVEENRLCEINHVTKSAHPESYKKKAGSVYCETLKVRKILIIWLNIC